MDVRKPDFSGFLMIVVFRGFVGRVRHSGRLVYSLRCLMLSAGARNGMTQRFYSLVDSFAMLNALRQPQVVTDDVRKRILPIRISFFVKWLCREGGCLFRKNFLSARFACGKRLIRAFCRMFCFVRGCRLFRRSLS